MFKAIDQLTVGFTDTPETNRSVVLAFDKTRADARKKWLETHIREQAPRLTTAR